MYRQSPVDPSFRALSGRLQFTGKFAVISPKNIFSPSSRQHGVQLLAKEIRASISRPSSSDGRASPHPQARPEHDTSAAAVASLKTISPLEITRPLTSLSVEEVQPETPNPKPETRNPKFQTRHPKLQTRNSKPDTPNPKPETRKPETRNPKSETRT
jgi:hypothetical protein